MRGETTSTYGRSIIDCYYSNYPGRRSNGSIIILGVNQDERSNPPLIGTEKGKRVLAKRPEPLFLLVGCQHPLFDILSGWCNSY